MATNIKKEWDENWDRNISTPLSLARELTLPDSVAWKKIMATLKARFGTIDNLKVIEIGAGLGRAAAKFAREGADVTLVDFSNVVISKAKAFFEEAHLKANFLVSDIFHLPDELKASFDISISFGLVEHFKKDAREKSFSIHAALLKKGGVSIIGMPNAYGVPYIVWRAMAKLRGAWEVGYEEPYTCAEIDSIMKKVGYNYTRFGTPFTETLNTYVVNKLNVVLTNLFIYGKLRARARREKVYKFIPNLKDRWSILDDWLGYHINFIYK